MTTNRITAGWLALLALLLTLNLHPSTVFAQGTAFTYQGRLNSGANPAGGIYDLRFTVYDDASAGSVWGVLTNAATPVTNGLFTVTLDFGSGVFAGNARWLDIAVRTNGASSFATLAPRQPLTPTPYAVFAGTAGGLSGTLPVSQISGVLSLAQLSAAVVTNGQVGNVTLNGSLVLPATATAADTIYSGNSTLLRADNNYNFFAGVGAGSLTTSGDFNTASGSAALASNTNGSFNTADGAYALMENTRGAANTAGGEDALYSNTSGSYNTAFGEEALLSNVSGFGNTALGFQAGILITGNGNIDIGNQGTATDNDIIRIGTPGNQTNTFIAGTLYGDGGGLTNLQAIGLGGNAASQSFFAGPSAGNLTMSGYDNTGVGYFSLHNNTTGGENTASGAFALGPAGAMTGSGNTADGYGALGNNNIGSYNTAVGYLALEQNVSGSSNIAVGNFAGYLTSGNNNIDIGNSGVAGESGVIRIGSPGTHTATYLAGTVTGNGGGLTNLNAGNITSGTLSPAQLPGAILTNSATGPYAVAVGNATAASANYAFALGTACTASAQQAFAFGSGAYAANTGAFVWSDSTSGVFYSANNNEFAVRASGGVRLVTSGAGMTVDGNVGIGTTSPAQKLVVQADDTSSYVDAKQLIIQGNTSTSQQMELGYKTSGNYGSIQVIQQNVGYKPLVLQPVSGNVGIGTTTPGYLLVVGGSGSPAYCNGTSWVNGSDRNSKEAFTAVNPRAVLEKVSALPITEWKYKVEADGTEHLGPMAQDFHAAFGLNGADDKHIATVDEEGVALAAIQGLNQKVEEQQAELKQKETEITDLKARLEKLEQLVIAKNGGGQ